MAIIARLRGRGGWDTSAAIASAALHIERSLPRAIVVVLSPDQQIVNEAAFARALHAAVETARGGPHWVSVGIRPRFAAPALGYMRTGAQLAGLPARAGLGYVEKPEVTTAQRFVDEGGYLWNAGIFAFSHRTLRTAFAAYLPGELPRVLAQHAAVDRRSIDHTLLEKLKVEGPVRHAFVEGQSSGTMSAPTPGSSKRSAPTSTTIAYSATSTQLGVSAADPCSRHAVADCTQTGSWRAGWS